MKLCLLRRHLTTFDLNVYTDLDEEALFHYQRMGRRVCPINLVLGILESNRTRFREIGPGKLLVDNGRRSMQYVIPLYYDPMHADCPLLRKLDNPIAPSNSNAYPIVFTNGDAAAKGTRKTVITRQDQEYEIAPKTEWVVQSGDIVTYWPAKQYSFTFVPISLSSLRSQILTQ
jgi:hypothetical protein